MNTTLKLMHFLNKTNIPVSVSTLQLKNSFPLLYRAGPIAADVLPALNPPDLPLNSLRQRLVAQQPGQDALLQLLQKQKEPVTILATGAQPSGGQTRKRRCRGSCQVQQSACTAKLMTRWVRADSACVLTPGVGPRPLVKHSYPSSLAARASACQQLSLIL